MSESILELLDDGSGVRVEGMPFHPSGKLLPPNALASKVLCEKHNSALSVLDDVALRLFRFLLDSDSLEELKGVQPPLMLDGMLVERWMWKVHAGLVAAGLARDAAGERMGTAISPRLVRIIFGVESPRSQTGLWLRLNTGKVVNRKRVGITIAGQSAGDGTPLAISADLNRLHFVCTIEPHPVEDAYHRVQHIRFVHASSKATRALTLKWPRRGAAIQVTVHPKNTAPQP